MSSLFLIAGKIICNAIKFAYDFFALKKIAVHYVAFQLSVMVEIGLETRGLNTKCSFNSVELVLC